MEAQDQAQPQDQAQYQAQVEYYSRSLKIRSIEKIKSYQLNLHPRIKERLTGSGFELIFSQNFPQVNIINALIEPLVLMYNVNTLGFDIGTTTLYFGLEDALMLTGLPIDGKPVVHNHKTYTRARCLDLVGVCPDDDYRGKSHHLCMKKLKGYVNAPIEDDADQELILRKCRAAAMIGIGTMIMQDASTSVVSTKYLQLLENVDEIKEYAWGAATWVNLHTSILQIRKSADSTGLSGCVLALQVFFFLHLPFITGVCYKDLVSLEHRDFPVMLNCLSILKTTDTYNKKSISASEMRRKLVEKFLTMTADNVVWKPYMVDPSEVYAQQRAVGRSITAVLCCNYALHHHPHVAHRQLLVGEPLFQQEWLDIQSHNILLQEPRPKKLRSDATLQRLIESWDSRRDRLISEMDNISLHEESHEKSQPATLTPEVRNQVPGEEETTPDDTQGHEEMFILEENPVLEGEEPAQHDIGPEETSTLEENPIFGGEEPTHHHIQGLEETSTLEENSAPRGEQLTPPSGRVMSRMVRANPKYDDDTYKMDAAITPGDRREKRIEKDLKRKRGN